MPAGHFKPGMDAFRPRRAPIPWEFDKMSGEQIVELLRAHGYSQEVAESDADAYLAYRDGTTEETRTESDRKESVSETGAWDRLINALRRQR